jgi:hypothetical protein
MLRSSSTATNDNVSPSFEVEQGGKYLFISFVESGYESDQDGRNTGLESTEEESEGEEGTERRCSSV